MGQGFPQLQLMQRVNLGISFVARGWDVFAYQMPDGPRLVPYPSCLYSPMQQIFLGFAFLLLPVFYLLLPRLNRERWEHPSPFEQSL